MHSTVHRVEVHDKLCVIITCNSVERVSDLEQISKVINSYLMCRILCVQQTAGV